MDIHEKIQKLLASPNYHPMHRAELARVLRIPPQKRNEFRRVLSDMLDSGSIVRIRKNKFVLPKEADLVVGRIEFSERGFAFVIPEVDVTTHKKQTERPADIYVSEEDAGVAMHRDKVVVRLSRDQRYKGRQGKPAGRVIRILERANQTLVGTLQKAKYFYYVVPDDPRFTRDICTKLAMDARVGDKVVIRPAEWKTRHVNPEGEIIEVLGKSDAPGVDILAIIRKHQLPTSFPEGVTQEVDKIPEKIPAAELKRRLDLRDQFIVTIDPDTAKDFDDAVNVDELPNGSWRLGVHIADVSHYVRVGTAVDGEAGQRSNSVYLVDRVLPMLPEKLSNNLCSLRPKVDRLTLSCIIEFTSKLTVKKIQIADTVICSKHRLTYKEAYGKLQSTKNSDSLASELKKMWRLASKLRAGRFRQGSLNLDFPEAKVYVDENGVPTKIEKIQNDISHQLIEEFMLAANEAVARHICNLHVPSIYRIHEDPDVEKLKDFREYAQSFGYKVGDVTHWRELQKLLAAVEGKPEQYAISLALLRSLKQARYSPDPIGHYGLAKKFYTHFTSPIRRYPDLVVHRTLRAIAQKKLKTQNGAVRYSLPELNTIAQHASSMERIAAEAEKESVELKKLEYFNHQLMTGKLDVLEAVVCGVRNFGLFVELPDTVVQGLIHVSTLEDDFYHYDEQRERLVGKRSHQVIQIGDKLTVQVDRVDIIKRQIDFRRV